MTNPAENAPEEGATSALENPAADTDMPALQPRQGEMPFAMVRGEAVIELPKDLYIPPQALEVFLDAFEGPLDLLLYLIRRQNLDILDIDVAQITEQYMRYVELMDAMQYSHHYQLLQYYYHDLLHYFQLQFDYLHLMQIY